MLLDLQGTWLMLIWVIMKQLGYIMMIIKVMSLFAKLAVYLVRLTNYLPFCNILFLIQLISNFQSHWSKLHAVFRLLPETASFSGHFSASSPPIPLKPYRVVSYKTCKTISKQKKGFHFRLFALSSKPLRPPTTGTC